MAQTNACDAVKPYTLSRRCSAACPPLSSCLIHGTDEAFQCNAATRSDMSSCVEPQDGGQCVYQCFEPYDDASEFRFRIAFNDNMPTPTNETDPSGQATVGTVPFESNEHVRRIGPLVPEPSITKVVLTGGDADDVEARGRVIDLEFDPLAFANATSVTDITLTSIDLNSSLPSLIGSFPPTLKSLVLQNVNVSSVPASLGTLSSLVDVDMSFNDIREWTWEIELPALQKLTLRNNSLTDFQTSSLQTLEYLDLSHNRINYLPFVIVDAYNLRVFKFRGNLAAPIKLKEYEFYRLSRLEQLEIDASAFDASSCVASEVQTIGSLKVCVIPNPPIENHTGLDGLPTGLWVFVCVALGISFVCIVVWVWCRCRQCFRDPLPADHRRSRELTVTSHDSPHYESVTDTTTKPHPK